MDEPVSDQLLTFALELESVADAWLAMARGKKDEAQKPSPAKKRPRGRGTAQGGVDLWWVGGDIPVGTGGF